MKEILFASAFMCSTLFAQDITLSSDSLLVYNNPVSSMAGQVQFVCHSSSPVRLDSAFLQIDDIDTVGIGDVIAQNMLETYWKGNNTTSTQFTWSTDRMSANLYRLHKKVFAPSNAEPLSFGAGSNTAEIFHLQIGYCFQCASFPRYPRYVRGALVLYFSNSQVVNLRLYSNDLRTTTKNGTIGMATSRKYSKSGNFVVNGRRLPKGTNRLHVIVR